MSRTPISDHRTARASIAVLAAIGAAWPAHAQDAASGFGLRSTVGSVGSASGATATAAFSPGSASTGTGPGAATLGVPEPSTTTPSPNRRLQRPATRRGRPAVQPVRAPVRAPLAPPTLAPPTQPQLNGVPDPVAAAEIRPRRRLPEDDPFASLGLRFGGLTVFPSVGESIGYDSNPNRTAYSRGSFVSQTDAELRVQSDWSRHELTGYLRGAYNEYLSVPEASRPEGAGKLALRLDASRDTLVNLEARYLIDTQRSGSPELGTAVRTRPAVFNEGASVGVTQRFNRLLATLQGTIDRTDYEDARTAAGLLASQRDRNLTQVGVQARLGYELTPGLIPFVEGLGNTRIYDRRVDFSGFARSSDGIGARLGSTFEISRFFTGEIAAGAIHRTYDDPRLRGLTSPLVDASLLYAITPLTTIKVGAQALVDETTLPGSNGVRTLRGTLEVIHALRRNLTVSAGLTVSDHDYQGIRLDEQGYGAKVQAEYKLTRSVAIRATYLYERLKSTLPSSSYETNVVLLGMRYAP